MSDRLSDIVKVRKDKLTKLAKLGLDPYPSDIKRTHSIEELAGHFSALGKKKITLVGRIRSLRPMGKIIFSHIEDGTGRFQIFFKEGELPTKDFQVVTEIFDIGDFVEVTGHLFKT